MQVKLIVTNKNSKEISDITLAVETKVIIGRHLGSPVLLRGDGLSRHHYSLSVVDGVLAVEDLSSNGTWLNGALLKAQVAARVKSGDLIEIPGYQMQVVVPETNMTESAPALIPPSVSPQEPGSASKPAWARPLIAALNFFDPLEVTLMLLAVATAGLISFCLER